VRERVCVCERERESERENRNHDATYRIPNVETFMLKGCIMGMVLIVVVFTLIRDKRDEVKPPRVREFADAEVLVNFWKNTLVHYPVVVVLHTSFRR
jgi:hypothetical protein